MSKKITERWTDKRVGNLDFHQLQINYMINYIISYQLYWLNALASYFGLEILVKNKKNLIDLL